MKCTHPPDGDTTNYDDSSAMTKDLVSAFDSGMPTVCERSLTLCNYFIFTLVIITFDEHTHGVIPYRREPYGRVPLGRVHLDERRLDEVQ